MFVLVPVLINGHFLFDGLSARFEGTIHVSLAIIVTAMAALTLVNTRG